VFIINLPRNGAALIQRGTARKRQITIRRAERQAANNSDARRVARRLPGAAREFLFLLGRRDRRIKIDTLRARARARERERGALSRVSRAEWRALV